MLLETGLVPQQALELILGRTEGNPLFIEEIVHYRLAQCLQTLEEAALIQRETGLPFDGILGVGRLPDEAEMENVSGLARAALAHSDLETARVLVAEMLGHIREFGLVQIRFPFLVYQTCIEVLQACAEDEQAHDVLKDAHDTLQERARRIADPKLRRSYLEQVPEHRWIVAAWREESAPR